MTTGHRHQCYRPPLPWLQGICPVHLLMDKATLVFYRKNKFWKMYFHNLRHRGMLGYSVSCFTLTHKHTVLVVCFKFILRWINGDIWRGLTITGDVRRVLILISQRGGSVLSCSSQVLMWSYRGPLRAQWAGLRGDKDATSQSIRTGEEADFIGQRYLMGLTGTNWNIYVFIYHYI